MKMTWKKANILIYFVLALTEALLFAWKVHDGTITKLSSVVMPLCVVLFFLNGLLALRTYRKEQEKED